MRPSVSSPSVALFDPKKWIFTPLSGAYENPKNGHEIKISIFYYHKIKIMNYFTVIKLKS